MYASKIKTNDLKLGTVVVLDSLSKSIAFGCKRSMVRSRGLFRPFPLHICGTGAAKQFKFFAHVHYDRLLPVGQKFCPNAAGVT